MKLKRLAEGCAIAMLSFLAGIILGDMKRETEEPAQERTYPAYKGTTRYDAFVFPSFGAATKVLYEMRVAVEAYGYATIADMCDLVGVQSTYIDNKYGWRNLDAAYVERVKGGYKISFPIDVALNN